MPELPEVETTRRGIAGHLEGKRIEGVVVRNASLRWPVPADLAASIVGKEVAAVTRRAKYLLIHLGDGHLLFHLGMSGSLRIVDSDMPATKHDHVDIAFSARDTPANGADAAARQMLLRFRDPRRFGALLWQSGNGLVHPLLAKLGPEPLSADFNARQLHAAFAKRSLPVKVALMDSHIVVGVGNIYASESLFLAGILPLRAANRLSIADCEKLVGAVIITLQNAIKAGGSTLKDFVDSEGKPGYFQQQYAVYGRTELPCHQCGTLIRCTRLGQRSTFWCPYCQKD